MLLTVRRLLRPSPSLSCVRGAVASCDSLLSSCGLSTPLSTGSSSRAFATTPPLCIAALLRPSSRQLQKSFGRPPPPVPPLRLHGTVTAFKHRRGYGFVLAEGVVPAKSKGSLFSALDAQGRVVPPASTADAAAAAEGGSGAAASVAEGVLHRSFFFPRASLGGGFFVTEGERVSFELTERARSDGATRHLGAQPYGGKSTAAAATSAGLMGEFSLDGAADADAHTEEEQEGTGDSKGRVVVAQAVRLYDLSSGTESPVVPIALYGKVVEWDSTTGTGVIAELDTAREFHEDAPRFRVSEEDCDLGGRVRLRVGRYVRFCLGPATTSSASPATARVDGADDGETTVSGGGGSPSPSGGSEETAGELVAQRVVVDLALERRRGAYGRPLVPATAEAGAVSDQTRFSGFVREIRNDAFGFVVDDLSGESIFFHATNARANVQEGDRVTYLLRELMTGRHKGKKACFDVRRITAESSKNSSSSSIEEETEEAERGDTQGDSASAGRRHGRGTAASPKGRAAPKKKSRSTKTNAQKSEEFDFDL